MGWLLTLRYLLRFTRKVRDNPNQIWWYSQFLMWPAVAPAASSILTNCYCMEKVKFLYFGAMIALINFKVEDRNRKIDFF